MPAGRIRICVRACSKMTTSFNQINSFFVSQKVFSKLFLQILHLGLAPCPYHLSGGSRHRLVQGQNRQSDSTRHRPFPGPPTSTRTTDGCNASSNVQLQPVRLARFVLAFLPDAPYTLALDRTQWTPGRIPINFLALSVVHDDIAFPHPALTSVSDHPGLSSNGHLPIITRLCLVDRLSYVGGE